MPTLQSHHWIETAITGKSGVPDFEIRARLFYSEAAVPQSHLVYSEAKGRFRLAAYFSSTDDKDRVKNLFKNFKGKKGLRFEDKTLRPADWRDKWKRDYHSFRVGKKLIVIPVWERKKTKPGKRIAVYMEPKSVFGAGTHESTRVMLGLIEQLSGKFKSYLDIGTGTGILASAAGKLGAGLIRGIDVEKESVETAALNARHNRIKNYAFFRKNILKFCSPRQFDLVGANLFTNLLMSACEKIVEPVRPGGYLIVSGIARIHLKEFLKGFKHAYLLRLKVIKGRKWSAVLYKKKKK